MARFRASIAAALLSAALCVGVTGCGQKQAEVRHDYKAEAEAVAGSCVSKDDCFLCTGITEYEGQNNVGIINLNTFDVIPIEINRYEDGRLMEENTGALRTMNFGSYKEAGYYGNIRIDADRGIATAEITFHGDEELPLTNAAQHLCKDHLMELASGVYRQGYGVGIVDFVKREIHPFQETVIAFSASDFYIHCDLIEDSQYVKTPKMDVLVVYTPLRYGNEAE